MVLKIDNVKDLTSDWRVEIFGEDHRGYQAYCELCKKNEEEIADLFRITFTQLNEALFCNYCVTELKVMFEAAVKVGS